MATSSCCRPASAKRCGLAPTPTTLIEFEGSTAYGNDSRIPFHVTTADPGAPAPAPEPDTASVAIAAPAVAPTLVLRVTLGQAKPRTVTCDGERVNIGQQSDSNRAR